MLLSRFTIRAATVGVAVVLVASACGTDSTASDSTAAATTTAPAPTTTAPPTTTDAATTTAAPTTTTTTAAPTTTAATTTTTTVAPAVNPPTTTTTTAAASAGNESTTGTDWANFEYKSAECGSFTPITLTDGGFFNHESAVIVDLVEDVKLDSGDTLVVLSCLAGASGGTQSTELLLFGPDANELDYAKLPLGEPVISPDGYGSLDYDVWADDDPRCCPSGRASVAFTASDHVIVVDESEEVEYVEE